MQSKYVHQGSKVRLSTDFDGGALAKVTEDKTDVLDCWPYTEDEYSDGSISLASLRSGCDQRDPANFCFMFRLDGCRNRKLTLRFHVVRERLKEADTSVVYANPDFPVFSYDGHLWQRASNKRLMGGPGLADEKIVSVEQTFVRDTVWIAHQYPFTNDHLSRFIKDIEGSPYCTVEVAGRSTEGRDIRQISITDPSIPLKDKKVAWFTGLQHSAELGAGWGLQGMAEFLLSSDPVAAEARQRYEFKIMPLVNVDSVSEGRGRIHSTGRNLNREWERDDPIREIATIRKTMDRWHKENPIDIFIDFHGFSAEAGHWTAPILPQDCYVGLQAQRYESLLAAIKKQIPGIECSPHPSEGFAAGAGGRRFGALSLSVDGYVYRWPSRKAPDLSSFFEAGSQIWGLSEIKAAGALFVKALVDFEKR